MKQVISITVILLTLLCASCTKDKTIPSTKASFQWTYIGTTVHADSVEAFTFNGGVGKSIYGWTGSRPSISSGFRFTLTSFAAGTYTDGSNYLFNPPTGQEVSPFTLVISTNADGTINGTFSGTYQHESITVTFSNVHVPQ